MLNDGNAAEFSFDSRTSYKLRDGYHAVPGDVLRWRDETVIYLGLSTRRRLMLVVERKTGERLLVERYECNADWIDV